MVAKRALDDYASSKDGYLTSVFAQDFLGLTYQELGDCNQSTEPKADKWRDYASALEWFVSCAGTEDASDDHRKILTQGYLHVGQLANHAAGDVLPITDTPARDMLKAAKRHLSQMTTRAPRAVKMPSGILALIEWALIEWKLDNSGEAIQILKKASDYAQGAGFDDIRNRANAVLGLVVAGGGTAGGAADPSVVSKVAEDLFSRGKYAEAVAAYQRVVAAAPRTPEALKSFIYPAWSRIGQGYYNLKLPVEAATAYDVLVDEVRAGRIVGIGEGDKTTRLASDAMDRERVILKELADKTGDPSLKERLNRFVDELIPLQKKLGDAGSKTADLAYRRARDLFEEGGRQKGDGAGDASKRAFADSRPFFLETAKNLKSEYQDAAWVYLCRVALELADYDGVIKAADDALAYWETPDSKKRAETEDKVGASRKGNVAAVTYWKAAAHHEAKRDDKAMEILDSFVSKFGKAAGDDYRGRALGLRVEILAALGKIEDAEVALDVLVKEVPDYYRMYQILVIVGGYYQKKADEIQQRIDVVVKEWLGTPEDRASGVKAKLFDAERNEQRLVTVLSDLNQSIDRLELFIREADQTKEREKEIKRKELEHKRKQKTEADAALLKVRADVVTFSKRRDELLAARAALQKEQAPPMRRTAEIYKKLDDVLKGLDKAAAAGTPSKRRADNVAGLAYRYFLLARQAEGASPDWALARDLYEDYLAFPEVKAAAETVAGKRNAQRFLGETYYRIAQASASADERRASFANAVKYLQASLARNPVNLAIVVAHLSGELPVLPFADLRSERTWRFPIPKVADVAALREYVKNLTPDRLPRYLNDATQTAYEKALVDFQKKIKDMPDDEAKRVVASLKGAGFEQIFFAEHGLTDNEFLLSLARAYARSGIAENEVRAVNAANAVLAGPSRPEEDTAEWWEAMTTKLEVLLAISERAASATGDASGEAKIRAKDAEGFLFSTWQFHPRIGGPDRGPLTLKEWTDLQLRVNAVMSRLGLTPRALDLTKVPAPEAAEPPPAPAPTAPAGMAEAPPAPAAGAAPTEPAMGEATAPAMK